jgi:uncharacterized membrane protein
MFSLYFTLKFIHVASVVIWIGAIASLNIMALQAARTDDPKMLSSLMGMFAYFGQKVIGPSNGIALLAGIGMVIKGKIPFMTVWVLWGIAGFLFHFIVGATALRKNSMELGRLAAAPTVDRAALEVVRKRQQTLAWVYMLVMFSVIWAMVAKPT